MNYLHFQPVLVCIVYIVSSTTMIHIVIYFGVKEELLRLILAKELTKQP